MSELSRQSYLAVRYRLLGDLSLRAALGLCLVRAGAALYLERDDRAAEATAPGGLRVRVDRHGERVGQFDE